MSPAAIPPTAKPAAAITAAAITAPVVSAAAKSKTDRDRRAVIVRIPAVVVRVATTVVVRIGRGRIGNRIDGGGRSVSGVRLNVSRRWLSISLGILCGCLRGGSVRILIDRGRRRSGRAGLGGMGGHFRRHVLALVQHCIYHAVGDPLIDRQ